MIREFVVKMVVRSDGDREPTDKKIQKALKNSTAAEALSEALGMEVTLDFHPEDQELKCGECGGENFVCLNCDAQVQ